MKFRLTVDTLATGLLLALALITGIVIFLGEKTGVRIRTDLPRNGIVSPLQTVTFTFYDQDSALIAFDQLILEPIHEGYLQVVNDLSFRYVPLKPFDPGIRYTFRFIQNESGIDDPQLMFNQTWEITVREPRVAYLITENDRNSIWSMTPNGTDRKRITGQNDIIISYDASQNGEFIIFSSPNSKGGVDLWRVSRNGGDSVILLDCGVDRCTTPVIAPDSSRIAYAREAAGPTPELPFGSPRIWVLDLQNSQNNPVYEDPSILGFSPSWSPDSNRLASFDGLQDLINIIDLKNGEQFQFESNSGGPYTWSPNSNRFVFTTFEQENAGGRTVVYLADLATGETTKLMGSKDPYDYSYSSIAWSQREDRAVISMRENNERPNRVLWVFDPSVLDGIVIASDPQFTYHSPQWDPWGNQMIFQQFKPKGQYKPEIGIWRTGTIQAEFLTNGTLPRWLP